MIVSPCSCLFLRCMSRPPIRSDPSCRARRGGEMEEGASVSKCRRRGGGVGGKPPRFEPIKESGARPSPRRINQRPRKPQQRRREGGFRRHVLPERRLASLEPALSHEPQRWSISCRAVAATFSGQELGYLRRTGNASTLPRASSAFFPPKSQPPHAPS